MDEGNSRVVGAGPGLLINHGCAFFKKSFYLRFDIIDLETDMVDSLALGLQELNQWRIRVCWLDEFDIRLTDREKPHLRLLSGNHFDALEFESPLRLGKIWQILQGW